ncbi:hypothetical protein DFQ11_10435 [Winogradskyella epiphytica]|uniref:YtxH domain-containing protein n=1 Tax=Winogradskyella epiphytica TaxID=262005 RepID=A0A2V4X670_9FLAO|nr:hypothetical protein [Winogradskyella epiphytica]PYE80669.1 hypothetical protein DFQ11_10435 [Winogradskyella epiphytica]
MKKVVLSIALVAFVGLSFTSCRETESKTEEAVETVEKETEGALEKIGKSVDNAVNETKEAGKAVEDAVDDIDNN